MVHHNVGMCQLTGKEIPKGVLLNEIGLNKIPSGVLCSTASSRDAGSQIAFQHNTEHNMC
jgi:hypothetical protein